VGRLNGFLTASGLLSAILLVWGQLWFQLRSDRSPDWANSFGLIWTFIAVLLSLLASGVAMHKLLTVRDSRHYEVPKIAVGLFSAAIMMAIIDILQSLFSNVVYTIFGSGSIPIWFEDLFNGNLKLVTPNCIQWLIYGIALTFLIVIIVLSIRFAKQFRPKPTAETKQSPLDIAKERYAKGEITKEQFDQIKKDLS